MAEIVPLAIAGKVAELLVKPVGKHICYPFECQSNIKDLKEQVEKLTDVRDSVLHEVDEAKRQGDEIKNNVQKWLDRVDDFTRGAVKTINDDEDNAKKRCVIGLCPNLMTRYSLSKKAAKMTKEGVDLLGEGNFEKVSYRPPLQRTNSIYIKGYEDFASRMSLFKSIMEALADADANVIGVYGMGGVGKTTLVKKVAWQAKEDKLFDVVVMAEVTETPDIQKIQQQIADELGLIFQGEDLSGRAARLRKRMKNEKKILVILDNVWKKLDLESIGIPLGDDEKGSIMEKVDQDGKNAIGIPSGDDEKGSIMEKVDQDGKNAIKRQCKILLTSRKLDVLRVDMDAQKNFPVNTLSNTEAEDLFWNTVGCLEEKSDFNATAVEIVRKCSGLPIAIKTIANALKKKGLPFWENALGQLRKANPRNIKGMDSNVYDTIELSYKFLEGEEAKSLFLLCSLCDAGYGVFLTDLLKYAMGLGLFHDVNTIQEGRNRLLVLVDDLKTSCLLIDDDDDSTKVKMHDIIHAFAISIASTTKRSFNIQDVAGLKELLEKKLLQDSTAISLLSRDINELPKKFEFQKLEIFLLYMKDDSLQIPDSFFEGMKDLKVLGMGGIHLLSLPSSLCCLINLHTLCFDGCRIRDVSIIGELKELEILSFRKSDIEQLPEEIRQLTRLRLLDLSKCSKLRIIKPNVISSLTRLEELYLSDSFVQWDVEGLSNASLAELKHLSALEVHVPDANIIPQDLSFEKLERYRIFIGDVWDWSGNKYETSRTLKLKWSDSIYFGNGIKSLLSRTEDLYLDELKGVKNVFYQLNGEGFSQLKYLHVQNGPEIQYIVNSIEWGPSNFFPKLESLFLHNLINLKKICHGQLATESFNKLRIIKVAKCDRLKHLFSFFMANNLLQLQEIEVTNCKKLEDIFFKESEEQIHRNERISGIEFSQLRTLTLECLPQLTSFGFNAFTHDIGLQEILAEDELGSFMPSFSQNVLLPSLEKLKLCSINIECMWLDQLPAMSSCCQTLTSLTLEECSGNLKFVFSYSVVRSLVLLQTLEIRNCKSIEGIINTEELRGEGKVIELIFPKLIKLQLKGLPKLTQFGSGNSVEFPSLTQLSVEDCPRLMTFFSSSTSADIKHSKQVEEMNCQDDIHPLFNDRVILPALASMNLSSILMQTIWHNQLQPTFSCFQNITKMIMDGCDTLKYVFSSSMVESFIQLNFLKISNCKLMEAVIIAQEERKSNTLFPKLHKLHLTHLPELTSFCNFAGNSIELPSLAVLRLENCPKMHAFVSNSPHADVPASKEEAMNSEENLQSQIQPLFDERVRIPILKLLRIEQLDNIGKIWHHRLTSNSFSKLDFFLINGCHNVLNVFPSNMLGRLSKLESLVVTNCNSIEEIFEELKISSCMVEEIVDEEEDVEAVHRFVFPQLTRLGLTDLPRLRSFYRGLYILEWPNLKKLQMWRCNKVEILTSKYFSLRESQLDNSIQEPLFIVDKVAFSKIEELSLEWNWIVKEIQHGNFSDYSCNLKFLYLVKPSKQSAICSSCFLYTLPNLEWLGVSDGFLEELFICEGLDCKGKHAEAPSKLRQLRLHRLEDVFHHWEENSLSSKVFRNLTSLELLYSTKLRNLVPSFVSFQNLMTLKISKCNGLLNLFMVSVAKSLVKLTRLQITECKMIEEIITHGGDEVEDRIIFNQLNYLELHCLPRLTSFYFGNHAIDFPSLQQVIVKQCPEMKIFSHGALRTHKLNQVQTAEAEEEGFWKGNLNTTIQKMFDEKVGFHGMENFTVSEFPNFKEVWHRQFLNSYFINLKSLVVDDKCSSLRYIFSPSVALGLVQLQKLQIKNCAILEAIIVIEEMIRNTPFPNLRELELIDLPELTSFCNLAGNSIELPSLSKLSIDNCPNMETFISISTVPDMSTTKDNVHANIQPLFDEKVQLPNLKFLRLDKMDKLRKLWHNQLTSNSFFKLNSFGVHNCHNLLNVFPLNMLGRLQKLDKLWLRNCRSLDGIFERQVSSCGKTQAITAGTRLTKLVLKDLPKLKHIWDMDSQGFLPFQNLLSIQVACCDRLTNIFPASIARSLLKVEELKIEECCMLEEIVSKEEEVDEAVPRFVFPKLTSLELFELSSLKSFFPGLHISEWPALRNLKVWKCDKVETFSSKSSSAQVTHEESQQEISMGQHLFLVDKVPFTNLESLQVEWNLTEKEVLQEKLPEYSCKLKVLGLRGFHKETDICLPCFLHKLPNLEKLRVHQGFFKEIFLCEGLGCEESHVEAPSKLSYLRLYNVSDSLHLWEENSLTGKVFQNLATLEVICCGNIKSLVSSLVSFQNLTTLEVSKCDALFNLVALSTANSFVQLRKMSVTECKMIKEIITHEGDEVEDWIIFKKLRYLELGSLPSLTSFYSGNYTIEFPSLQQVVVRECPNMKIFSGGILSTPWLHKVQTAEAEEEGFWKGNLNTTIEHLFIESL